MSIGNGSRRRRIATIIMAFVLFCLAAVPSLAEAPEQFLGMTLNQWRNARVFFGTLDSVYTLPTWEFVEQEDVPWISVKDYTTLIFVETYDPNIDYSWDGDVLLITRNGMSVRVDTANQKVSCANWHEFLGPHAAGALPDGVVEKEEFLAIRPSEKSESTQTEAQGFEICLSDYGVEMLRGEDDVLMPFAVAQAIFAGPAERGVLAYNGEDYFDIVNSVDDIYGSTRMAFAPNPYANMYFSGSFARREELSEAYAKYNYAGMCMLLDITYGHKAEKGITTFDSYMEENDLKAPLLTPDPKDDVPALTRLFSFVFVPM